MSESNHRQTVVVGLFVAFGALLLAGGVLTVGNINDTFTRKLDAHAVFSDVGGLRPGDNVWFSGVKVGSVARLDLQAPGEVAVDLRIDRVAARRIPGDASAKLSSDGIIGSAIVVLFGGTVDGPTTTDGQVYDVVPVASTDEMLAILQENNRNMRAITADLRVLTARLVAGEGTAGKLLQEDDLYTRVMTSAAALEVATRDAERIASSMRVFAGRLNQEGRLPNQLVTDERIFPALVVSASDMRGTAADAAALTAGLRQRAEDPHTALGALIHDGQAGADAQATLSNLARASHLLAEDLEAAQHTFLLRRYFKKRDKEAARVAEGAGSTR